MPTIGLSMIVKDGGDDLRLCLQSARGAVDQIVIADTGSSDDSVVIAKEFGARVISFPWANDFAAARNAALERMTTEWVLVLDADEELSAAAAAVIPALLERGEGVGGYLLPIRNYFSQERVHFCSRISIPNHDAIARAACTKSWAEHELCRLFRNDPRIRYGGRVHEVVEPAIQSAGLELRRGECRILHFGQLADERVHQRKARIYRDLGRAKIAEEPENARAWFELAGIELSRFNNQPVALECLRKAVQLEPKLLDAWVLLFQLHDYRGEYEQALAIYMRLSEMRAAVPVGVEQRCGDYLHDRGRIEEARRCYLSALSHSDDHANGISESVRLAIESKLGYTEVRLGDADAGLRKLREAAEKAPSNKENRDRLWKATTLCKLQVVSILLCKRSG